MKFYYEAKDKTGEIKTGLVESSNEETAFDILKKRGLFVTLLEKEFTPIYARRIKFFERVKKKEIVYFSRQLAIMFKSKIPLIEIFQTIYRQTKNKTLKEIVFKISKDIEGGSSLSDALISYPHIFSKFYINMVKAGETSGKLSTIFLYLADYLEKDSRFRGKIISALIYPFFILLVSGTVIILIVTMVIPSFKEFLKETQQEIPLITKMIIAFSDFFKKWGWLLISAIVVSAGSFYFLIKKNEFFKKNYDKYILKIPVLNVFLKKIYLNRFALNIHTLISGGVTITQSLEITAEIIGNDVYKKIILKTRDEVKKGEKMSDVLERFPDYITPFFYQMVVVGEKTGTLDSTLLNIVKFYEEEIDRTLESFTKLIEPILIVLLGGMVGFLIGAVLIPLYSSIGNIK